jgi:uncharacterized protein YkwD
LTSKRLETAGFHPILPFAKGRKPVIVRPILIAALSILAAAAEAQAPAPAPAPSSLEEQVLAEINNARTDPAGYAAVLREYRGHFEGNVVHLPGSDVGLRTREGAAAVDEAIAFLGQQAPLMALRSAPELVEAAREVTAAQLLAGGTGHGGTDGSDAKARIKKRKGSGFMAEALAYGAKDAAGVVRQLIVDDGVPTRPNRKILFDKRYFRAGIACGSHPVARSVCVIDLSSFVGLPPVRQLREPPPTVDIR